MNPERSVQLLDTVRMLWHPRVAFVLTGDSELFVLGLVGHCLRQLPRPLRKQLDQEADAMDAPTIRQLASDIYDKVIPTGHRCTLPYIPRTARATFLLDTFEQILVEPGPKRAGPKLASYFEHEPQLAEALPDRLRGLIDLRERCRLEMRIVERERRPQYDDNARDGNARIHAPASRTRGPKDGDNARDGNARMHAPASRIVESIWRHALNSSAMSTSHYRDLVYIDEDTGALHIRYTEPVLGLDRPSPRVVASLVSSEKGPGFAILRAPRLDAMHDGKPLARPVTAALMLASDVAADQKDGRWDSIATNLTGYEELFAASTYRSERGSEGIRFVWPLPTGYPFSFYAAFHSRWKEETKGLTQKGRDKLSRSDVDEAAKRFIRLVLHLVTTNSDRNLDAVDLEWRSLAEVVKQFIDQGRPRSRRWALRRAGLFAAPEFGLSATEANKWLIALANIIPEKILFENLYSERRASNPDLSALETREKTLKHIDGECSNHQWARLIENPSVLPEKTAPPVRGNRRKS